MPLYFTDLQHPLTELGMLYFYLGEFQRSIETLEKVQNLQQSAGLSGDHPEVCMHHTINKRHTCSLEYRFVYTKKEQ